MLEKNRKFFNLKGHEILQLDQNISSLQFLKQYFWVFFLSLTLNCHISKTVRDFDLIPTLRARPKYQLSSGSLFVEDYTQQNRWDYTQQNHDWAALQSFKCNLWVLIVKKVVWSNQKTHVFHWSVTTKLSKIARSPNLSLAPLRLTLKDSFHPTPLIFHSSFKTGLNWFTACGVALRKHHTAMAQIIYSCQNGDSKVMSKSVAPSG